MPLYCTLCIDFLYLLFIGIVSYSLSRTISCHSKKWKSARCGLFWLVSCHMARSMSRRMSRTMTCHSRTRGRYQARRLLEARRALWSRGRWRSGLLGRFSRLWGGIRPAIVPLRSGGRFAYMRGRVARALMRSCTRASAGAGAPIRMRARDAHARRYPPFPFSKNPIDKMCDIVV